MTQMAQRRMRLLGPGARYARRARPARTGKRSAGIARSGSIERDPRSKSLRSELIEPLNTARVDPQTGRVGRATSLGFESGHRELGCRGVESTPAATGCHVVPAVEPAEEQRYIPGYHPTRRLLCCRQAGVIRYEVGCDAA